MNKTEEQREITVDEMNEGRKVVVRKIYVVPEVITKMKRLSSLYADEIPEGAKEIDIVSFFFNKSFELYLRSGEIDRKVDEIKRI